MDEYLIWRYLNFEFQYLIRFASNFEYKSTESKAIETGMILLNMDMKNQLLCVFFIDLYSPR